MKDHRNLVLTLIYAGHLQKKCSVVSSFTHLSHNGLLVEPKLWTVCIAMHCCEPPDMISTKRDEEL